MRWQDGTPVFVGYNPARIQSLRHSPGPGYPAVDVLPGTPLHLFRAGIAADVEALLIHFHVGGQAVGTVRVISHDANRRFDAGDLREYAGAIGGSNLSSLVLDKSR